MLAGFYIPRLSNDMRIAVQKNHLVGQIWYRSLVPSKKRRLSHAVWQQLAAPLVTGRKYNVLFNVKVFGSGTVRAFTANENGEKIAASPASIKVGNDQASLWMQHEWSFDATGNEFYILFFVNGGGDGDAIFDHAYLVTKVDFLACREKITFSPSTTTTTTTTLTTMTTPGKFANVREKLLYTFIKIIESVCSK